LKQLPLELNAWLLVKLPSKSLVSVIRCVRHEYSLTGSLGCLPIILLCLYIHHNAMSYHCVCNCVESKTLYQTPWLGQSLAACTTFFLWKGGTFQDLPFSLVIRGIKVDPNIGLRGVLEKPITNCLLPMLILLMGYVQHILILKK
jgi:hypothetical protein